MAAETEHRHVCSSLVTLQLPAQDGGERELVGNLEEISTSRACLNVEEPIAAGLAMRLVCPKRGQDCVFPGKVVGCRHDARAGYYVSVEFDPGHCWTPEVYTPKHMVRANTLLVDEPEGASLEVHCCERGVCPKEVISRLLEPEFPLSGRVQAVAQEVAALCGELTESDAASCFGSLFGAGAECRLFAEFQEAYAKARTSGDRPRHRDLRSQVETLVQMAGAVPTEAVESDSCVASLPWLTPIVPSSGVG